MNEQNLKSIGERTTSEQREITRAGGIKSGEARRRNRDIKKIVAAIMQGEPDAATADQLRQYGIDERDITNKTALVLSLYDAAKTGNVRAFETLMKYSGEDPDQQRKDMELQFKREVHIITLNDKDYSGFGRINLLGGDDEKQQVLLAIQKNYKELKTAHDDYVRNNVTYIDEDDDDDYDDDDYTDE